MNLKILIKSIFISILMSASMVLSAEQSQPQTEDEKPRWFEIEIIVFKPTNDRGLLDESWAKKVELNKAENLIDLLQPYYDPNNLESNTVTESELAVGDAQLAGISEKDLSAQAANNAVVDIHSLDEEAKLLAELNKTVEEKPFVLLADELLQLNNEAASLSRHPDYKVLTHLGWRQPVLASSEAPHVRIAGGQDYSELYDYQGNKLSYLKQKAAEQFDALQNESQEMKDWRAHSAEDDLASETQSNSNQASLQERFSENGQANDFLGNQQQHVSGEQTTDKLSQIIPMLWVPELDGDIKIYLSRFLHIRTNLYIRRPDKEEIEVVDLEQFNPQMLFMSSSDKTDNVKNSQHQLDLEKSLLDPSDQSTAKTQLARSQDENLTEDNLLSATNQLANAQSEKQGQQFSWDIDDNFLESESEKMYLERLFNYSVNQSRRVRSGELHYFDHPLLGILIMIRPYELQQLPLQSDPLQENLQ